MNVDIIGRRQAGMYGSMYVSCTKSKERATGNAATENMVLNVLVEVFDVKPRWSNGELAHTHINTYSNEHKH